MAPVLDDTPGPVMLEPGEAAVAAPGVAVFGDAGVPGVPVGLLG
jgi:hypothetical protein